MAASVPPYFKKMFRLAAAARKHAYVPYSSYRVGAAVRDERGRIFAGVNVENAAYLQCCAETSAIGALVTAGGKRITAAVVVAEKSPRGFATPCGSCRQRLRELATPDLRIMCADPKGLHQTYSLGALLPESFGPEYLPPAKLRQRGGRT